MFFHFVKGRRLIWRYIVVMAQSLFLSTSCARHLAHSVRPRNSQSVRPVLFPANIPWQLLLLLPVVSALACVPALAQGWDKEKALAPSVIVDLGTPQIFTMEQAHYLLERNRALDLGLQEQNPSPLNPNDTAGVRASALQTLFSGSVSFDAALGAKNRAAVTQFNSQVAQYNALYSQRAVYMAQQAAVTGALAAAQIQLQTLQAASPPATQAIAQQQNLISQLTAQNTMLSSEITSLDSVIGTAPTVPNISTSAPADETTATALGSNSTFDNIVKGFNTGPGASKLSASVQLDNYVNFQYEMVAKQLTLLQDQAGPNSRVLFVELPHSIYVTDKLHLYPYFGGLWGHHLVQSWWTIGGALQVKPLNEWAVENGAHRPPTLLEAIELNRKFEAFAKTGMALVRANELNELKRLDDIHDANVKQLNDDATATINDLEAQKRSLQAPAAPSHEPIKETPESKKAPKCNCPADNAAKRPTVADLSAREERILSQLSADIAQEDDAYKVARQKATDAQTPEQISAAAAQSISWLALKAFLNSYSSAEDHQADAKAAESPISGNFNFLSASNKNSEDQTNFDAWASYWLYGAIGREIGTPGSESAPIYALDLIPRQSSLNVAEANASTRQIGFAGVFSWLSGLGARARYERQKQEFSQYTQVETYATAFGKGDFTFGWTFGPNPGTKQIGAGLRTTYAILVVPKDTRVVRLNAIGCGYRRREVPRNPFAPATGKMKEPESNGLQTWTGPTAQNKLDSEDCGRLRTFDVDVPNSDDNFWIENAQYTPVPAGQRATLTISGRFGDTVGVLVNGTPLQKVPSITQPLLTPAGYAVPTNAGDAGTQGVFEIVHTRNPKTDNIGSDIVASFTMPAAFVGTPRITIVSAARDKLVNEVPSGNKLSKSRRHLLDGDPMFYVLPAVTRVDADYSNDVDTIVKIVGRGFDTHETSSVVFGADALTLHADPTTALAEGEYQVLASGAIIQARVKREKYFPQWSIDYVSQLGKQVVDATIARDDSAGPVVADPGCTFVADTAKDGNLPVKFAVKGKFFSSSMTTALAVPGKSASATPFTQQFVNANEWDFTATVPVGTSQIAVSFTPAPATKNLARTVLCSAPPAKKVLKAKAANKPAPRPAAMPETNPVTKNPSPPSSPKH
jgi:hypothetical protein